MKRRCPNGFSLERMLADEHRWANNQVAYVRGVLAELRTLAELTLADYPANA